MEEKAYIHPTSCVDQPCSIGGGTRVWHFCHIMQGATIGRDCNLGQNVMVGRGVSIGNRCKIQNNVSVYEGVVCEDEVFVGPSVVFTNVINPRSFIERKHEFRPTTVRRGATIGANATLVCGVEIGRYAFVGAGAVVTRDVPPYALMVGNPAVQLGWVCECGNRIEPAEGDACTCPACGKRFVMRDGRVGLID